jgi:uncharacterized lipoprotein YmbA
VMSPSLSFAIARAVATLGSCVSPNGQSLYIELGEPRESAYPAAPIPVFIRSVTVHELVDRPQTVVHAWANHVVVEKFARWTDPLTSQIPRVLAADVAQILNSPRVSAYPICGVQGAAYRVQLDVQHFDVTHGEVATVDVLWSVSPPAKAYR